LRETNAHEAGSGIDKIAVARDVARKELGGGAIVTSANPGRTYSGRIIGVIGDGPDKTAIQAISDNHAVLHSIKNISDKSNLKVGEEAVLAADEQGYSAVQGMEAETRSRKREGHRL
jgi:hypothetical protein